MNGIKDILKNFKNITWYDSINELHKPENIGKHKDFILSKTCF